METNTRTVLVCAQHGFWWIPEEGKPVPPASMVCWGCRGEEPPENLDHVRKEEREVVDPQYAPPRKSASVEEALRQWEAKRVLGGTQEERDIIVRLDAERNAEAEREHAPKGAAGRGRVVMERYQDGQWVQWVKVPGRNALVTRVL